MDLSRTQIVEQMVAILGPDQVITDEALLKEASVDRFRKYESICGVYTRPIPAAIVKPNSTQEVAAVLQCLHANQIHCVPRTGGSATEGGLETRAANSVIIDGSAINQIYAINEQDMIATAGCGTNLEVLENEVRQRGLTTGHSPQSKPLAQMGGLVATRSIGQFSTLYGGIEDMVIGLEAVLPDGTITRIKNVPRRAAGPDIRHMLIGNEGTLAYITEVSVKLFRHYPDNNIYYGYRLDSMQTGFEILREVMVQGYRPSVARLYDAADGAQHGFDKFAGEQCLLIFVAEGPANLARATGDGIAEIVAGFPACQPVDASLIENWFTHLNWGPEKVQQERDFIKAHGNMGFTTEVSGNWSCIHDIYVNAIERIRKEFAHAEDLTMLGGHSSHSYQTGTNMYFVYDYNIVDCQPEEEIEKYHKPINAIIVEEALRAGGSMVHHHGIGKYRTQWTRREHGSAYVLLEALKQSLDPTGIMNPGTIYPDA